MLWIRNDRTGELFPHKYAASEALGICPAYVVSIAHGKKRSTKYKLSIYNDGFDVPKDVSEKQEYQSKSRITKCADCGNFYCSWIQKLKPVAGWDAVKVPKNDSYIVRDCPEFKPNERRNNKE